MMKSLATIMLTLAGACAAQAQNAAPILSPKIGRAHV